MHHYVHQAERAPTPDPATVLGLAAGDPRTDQFQVGTWVDIEDAVDAARVDHGAARTLPPDSQPLASGHVQVAAQSRFLARARQAQPVRPCLQEDDALHTVGIGCQDSRSQRAILGSAGATPIVEPGDCVLGHRHRRDPRSGRRRLGCQAGHR